MKKVLSPLFVGLSLLLLPWTAFMEEGDLPPAVPACTEDTWVCVEWSACSAEGNQTRTCDKTVDCPTVDTLSPIVSQSCVAPVVTPILPEITSLSPTQLVPGDTVITISGQGFGDTFKAGANQICFDNQCIRSGSESNYLQQWSDSAIVLKVPPFVTVAGMMNIGLFVPSHGQYAFFQTPAYTLHSKPRVVWYYPTVEQGGEYTIKGEHFGVTTGRLTIAGQNVSIKNWSDSEITFKIPRDAQNGLFSVFDADGVKSQDLSVAVLKVAQFSDDPYSRYQWQMKTLNIVDAWTMSEGSEDVLVAVIDSGVNIEHPDLTHAIWTNPKEIANNGIDDDKNGYIDDLHGWDFVRRSHSMKPIRDHGTMVASLIVAQKNNGIGIAGVAPRAKIMPLNVAMDDGVAISVDATLEAIKYAVDNGAHIINLSFGGFSDATFYSDIIQYAHDNNVLIVAATGNDGQKLDANYSPVCVDLDHNKVVGVAATNELNKKTSFSNYGGACTDLSAPGQQMMIPYGETYGTSDGTSFAAPLITGIATLLKTIHVDWNVEELKAALFHVDNLQNIDADNPDYKGQLGRGIPNAFAVLQTVRPQVAYEYKPHTTLTLKKTGAQIKMETPEVIEPIDTPEPVKEGGKEEAVVMKEESPSEPSPVSTEKKSEEKRGDALPEVKSATLTDIDGYRYESAIVFLEKRRVIRGYPDLTFRPNTPINRAEFTKIVINAFQKPVGGDHCFPDVNEEWFAPFVCAAQKAGIIKGYPDGRFRPDQTINTVEALKIILETHGVHSEATHGETWYSPYVRYALDTGLKFILTENQVFQPVTRGQMAELIRQVLD